VIGIVVQSALLQKGVEVREITAIEQDHGLAVRRNVALRVLSAQGNRCDDQSHTQAGKAAHRF
jgi:hypothetical protein